MQPYQTIENKHCDNECTYLEPSSRLGLSERFEEFKVKKWPDAILNVRDLHIRKDRVVWFTEEAFLHPIRGEMDHRDLVRQGYTSEVSFAWSYNGEKSAINKFTIRSKTNQATTECLNRIVARLGNVWVPMDTVSIQWYGEEGKICPLAGQHLRRLLMSSPTSRPSLNFINMDFTAAQCRVLGSCNFESLNLHSCTFLDGGEAFLKCCPLERNQPTSLHMRACLPFENETWKVFLSQLSGRWTLSLNRIDFVSRNLPTPAPEIDRLSIRLCLIGDAFDALTAAVVANRGPREITFFEFEALRDNDGTKEGLQRFISALGNNEHVEKLSLDHRFGTPAVAASLADALRKNTKLKGLMLNLNFAMTGQSWDQLLAAIAANSSLVRIGFDQYWGGRHALKNVLSTNKQIEEIKIVRHGNATDRDTFHNEIEPLLEINRYRKRLGLIHREPSEFLRAGLLGRSLRGVTAKPSSLWLALQLNQDVVVSQIQSGHCG